MRFSCLSLILPLALLTVSTGCRQEESVEKYLVVHEEREPIHLRVGIVKHDNLVWFFRLSGPESLVKGQLPTFNAFVESVRFDDKDKKALPITWTEPKSWKKDPPGGERYAGFRIDTKPKPLEVTVTKLPSDGYSLVRNVQRWQKQINLPLSETAGEAAQYVERAKLGNQEITWVDMKGLGIHSVSKPPDPLAADKKKLALPFRMDHGEEKPGRGGSPFASVMPAGWIKKAPRKIAVEVYEVADGDNVAEVTLVPLPSMKGFLAANIKRWRSEVKLPELPDEELVKSAETIRVAGKDSFYVDLANPKGPPGKNHTLGVIIPMGPTNWFVKMSGPLDWVSQNKNAFETFVKSFELEAR